ncbi:MAG TPA: EAL domain-containing protein [Enterovirga sp.]|nr:EAL domain-containing protein [Enterovirga sp.]
MIVDDIADNRDILARRFQRRGFEITQATGGYHALELIEQQDFDLVLLDVMMPDLEGTEVLKRVRERHSAVSLPIIMVTAKSQSEDVVSALELGANDYVTKPVDFAVALARANAQIGRKRAEEAAACATEALRVANEDLERRVFERTAELVAANSSLKDEVAQRLKSEAEIQYLAHHDALTGLANRVLFRKELERALATRARNAGLELAVLFLDLDGFKGVNDTLGHSIGDGLLKAITNRLQDVIGETDKIARLGGDEFAILQVGQEQPGSAANLAGRIIQAIGAPCLVDGHQVVVGGSIGITVVADGHTDPDQLLKSADLAMYRAKADGRGTYRFFEPEMDAQAQARRSLEIDLRQAMLEGAFELYYQPIVNLAAKRASGCEALLRWKHPERGFVSPAEFIPVAEETGLIVQIGDWALRQACTEAASWPDGMRVAVNLSPVQFKSGNVVASVVSALAASGLPAARLEVEVTESVLLEKTEENLSILRNLHELGVRISLDDFGTGYSSLSYLQSFRFDKIKIDRSFVRDLRTDSDNIAIVRAIAGLGTSFGVTTTAEGVETEEELRCIEQEGCTEVQGYFYSPPKPAAELPEILARIQSR